MYIIYINCTYIMFYTYSYILCLTIFKGKNYASFNSVHEWLLLIFLISLYNQLSSIIHSIITYVLRVQMFEKCDSSNKQ